MQIAARTIERDLVNKQTTTTQLTNPASLKQSAASLSVSLRQPDTLPGAVVNADTAPAFEEQPLYVIGGQQRTPRSLLDQDQQWYDYQRGLILRVDPVVRGQIQGQANNQAADQTTYKVETVAEHVSPPEACAPGAPVLYKSGSVRGDRLYVCTQTEVLVYHLPDFTQIGYISLSCFNDVHHVIPASNGNLLVAISGLDLVVEVTLAGEVVREWDVYDGRPWTRFSRKIDYRQGISTKPHKSHPNFLASIPAAATSTGQEQVWVTRFEQRDALCLEEDTAPDNARRIAIDLERIHDGYWHNGRLYYTTVNGNVVIANPTTAQVEEVIDLTTMHEPGELLGWCRGILVEGDKAWIGFSRIRPTKFREAVSWVRVGFKQSLPTHVACYDLAQRRCLRQISLEEAGLNAVFSIFPAH